MQVDAYQTASPVTESSEAFTREKICRSLFVPHPHAKAMLLSEAVFKNVRLSICHPYIVFPPAGFSALVLNFKGSVAMEPANRY
jgi:hypothetical protein